MADLNQIWNNFKNVFSDKTIENTEAFYGGRGNGNHMFSIPFDGEKNLGEIGPIKKYELDYDLLRLRSWQSYLESEITQTVINKFTKWVIGSGLKLQSEPNKIILEDEGIKTDFAKFSKMTEAKFSLFAKSRKSDYSKMCNLNKLERVAFINAKIGGDILVILRYDGQVTVQLVDGQHVRDEFNGSDYFPKKLENGNTVKNGIEISPTGEHIAYYVSEGYLKKPIRIEARNKRGIIQAFLLYGFQYRLDNHRGMPLISAVLETLKKLERYKEATVGSAEERAKVVGFIEHTLGSSGENPLGKQLAKAFNDNREDLDLATDISGNNLADRVAATTNKSMYNLPPGATMKSLDTKNDLYFKEFYEKNIEIICACLGIPHDVAMSMYNSNFSASRAALKDWEHTLLYERSIFKDEFMQHVYDFWFEVMIHENKIQAPGYITAPMNSDIREAYRNCRFVGANVPHIDPLKEVNAERAKLGDTGKSMPLTTLEAATEALNGGDSSQNIQNYAKEKEEVEKLGIKVEIPVIEPVKQKESK
jgi:capsid protein